MSFWLFAESSTLPFMTDCRTVKILSGALYPASSRDTRSIFGLFAYLLSPIAPVPFAFVIVFCIIEHKFYNVKGLRMELCTSKSIISQLKGHEIWCPAAPSDENREEFTHEGDGVMISHNTNYPPRPMTEDIRCQGLVLGVCDESYFA